MNVRLKRITSLGIGACFLACLGATHLRAQPPEADAANPPNPAPVLEALDQLDAWLGDGSNGDRWRRYLNADQLRSALAEGAEADPMILARTLRRLSGDANGLKMPRFQEVRARLSDYLNSVWAEYDGDVSQLAESAGAGYRPITSDQLAALRATMREKAYALERAMGGDTQLARNWKAYLLWDQLTPHFAENFEVTRSSLTQLDEVLQRFRANQQGLELPYFTETARAIARYRALAPWAAASQSRDLQAQYERLLSSLGAELRRHFEKPTTETAWQIGRVLGVVDSLGHSTDLVAAVRNRFVQKNISLSVSKNFVEKLPDRDIDQLRPVRDCILGTNIFGSAHTMGQVRYELVPSDESVVLMVHLDGHARSQTRGYNGPVRINSTGNTVYTASKRLIFTDDAFEADPAVAHVDTRTRINSIQKTGGQFAANLIEKVAWKRASQSKRQAERISAEHTRQNVIKEFNERVAKDLGDARLRYQTKIRDPLVRRSVKPEYLKMSSSPNGVSIESTFASRNQLGADREPPPPSEGADLVVQIHESAVNNYLPLALASARISQATADQAPILEGNVPNWIKLLSLQNPDLAAAAATGAALADHAADTLDQVVEGEADERGPDGPPALPPFKPYSVTLNGEAPVGVRFADDKAIIRVRAATLASEDAEYTNWDFIVTYAITRDGDRIILKRVGEIEVFPTGFDPAWDKQLTAQQSGFRSTLAKNMNARAKAGESFPAEIPIEPIRITRLGALLLNQLEAKDGWLTVSWLLPPPATP